MLTPMLMLTAFSPVDAVRRSDDPAGRDDGAATQVFGAEVQTDLPGELPRAGDVAPDDAGAEAGPPAAIWGRRAFMLKSL